MFQSFNLFPQYTALENVMLAEKLLAKEPQDWKQNKSVRDREIKEHAESLLADMGLQDRMGNYPFQLSGGQCQRVAIARALALNPDILCFDEPTSALDPELTGEVLRVIRGLAARNTTMIIVTHEMAFARDVADHVIFMDGGKICEEGDPKEVFAKDLRGRRSQRGLRQPAAGADTPVPLPLQPVNRHAKDGREIRPSYFMSSAFSAPHEERDP